MQNIQNIKFVKLTSGLDIIGKFVDSDDDNYHLDDALLIQIVPTQGGLSVQFIPLDMFSESSESSIGTSVSISKNQTLYEPKVPHSNLSTRYLEEISGIDLSAANKPGIITQ